MFSNADILFWNLERILNVKNKIWHGPFIAVGRRVDINPIEICGTVETTQERENGHPTFEIAQEIVKKFGWLHGDVGVDYFFFPKPFPIADMPPFLLGVWRWDNFVIVEALRQKVNLLDLSPTVLAVHLNNGAASSKYHSKRYGAQYNEDLWKSVFGETSAQFGNIGNTQFMTASNNNHVTVHERAGDTITIHLANRKP